MPDVGNWTDDQWASWYESEVEPGWNLEDVRMAGSHSDPRGLYETEMDYMAFPDKYPPEMVSDFMEILHYYEYGDGTRGSMATAFLEMSKESRIRFYEQWQDTFGTPGPANAGQAEWAAPVAAGTMVSLPDGSVADLSDVEYQATDGTFVPPPNTVKKALVTAGVIGAVAVIVILVFLFNGGDSAPENLESADSSIDASEACDVAAGCAETEPLTPADDGGCDVSDTCDEIVASDCGSASGCDVDDSAASQNLDLNWFAEDPIRDLFRTFDDLDGIDPDRSLDGVSGQDFMDVVDLVGMTVASKGSDSTISLHFSGAAEDIRTEEIGTLKSRSVMADVIITPPEGRILNVIYRADGKIKISDIPAGMSISSEWVTPNELFIIITGLALNPGTLIEAYALFEAYGGFMSDVVTLLLSAS